MGVGEAVARSVDGYQPHRALREEAGEGRRDVAPTEAGATKAHHGLPVPRTVLAVTELATALQADHLVGYWVVAGQHVHGGGGECEELLFQRGGDARCEVLNKTISLGRLGI